MSALHIVFPTRVSDGSTWGPEFKTDVLEYKSGYESTDQKWPYPRIKGSINAGTLDEGELQELYDFFWVVAKGKANSFLFEDPWDHKSCGYASTIAASDQLLITNLSVDVTSVQLQKTYTYLGQSLVRTIFKPQVSTVVFMVDSSTRTTGFSVNSATGIASFGPALASGIASVRAGFEFYTHARFDIDHLPVTFEGGLIANTRIPFVEKQEA